MARFIVDGIGVANIDEQSYLEAISRARPNDVIEFRRTVAISKLINCDKPLHHVGKGTILCSQNGMINFNHMDSTISNTRGFDWDGAPKETWMLDLSTSVVSEVKRGDFIQLYSRDVLNTGQPVAGVSRECPLEYVRVAEVVVSSDGQRTKLWLQQPTRFEHSISPRLEVKSRMKNWQNLNLEGLTFIGDGSNKSPWAFGERECPGLKVLGITVENAGGVAINSPDVTIRDITINNLVKEHEWYGLVLGGAAENFRVYNLNIHSCRHPFTTSGVGLLYNGILCNHGGQWGVIDGGRVSCRKNTTLDSHAEGGKIIVRNIRATSAPTSTYPGGTIASFRNAGTRLENCVLQGCGKNEIGIVGLRVSAPDLELENVEIINCYVGIDAQYKWQPKSMRNVRFINCLNSHLGLKELPTS